MFDFQNISKKIDLLFLFMYIYQRTSNYIMSEQTQTQTPLNLFYQEILMPEVRGDADKVCEVIREHFSLDELYDDEDLEEYFQEKLEEGGEFESMAWDYISSKIDEGEMDFQGLITHDKMKEVVRDELRNSASGLSRIAYDHIKEECSNYDLNPCDFINLDDDEHKAQLFAFVQANFTRDEIFPEDTPITPRDKLNGVACVDCGQIETECALKLVQGVPKCCDCLYPESTSISGEVSRQLETLEAQNAKLVAENQKLQQQLASIKALLHAN